MRRGCISLGKTKCDGCQCVIPYLERYLIVEETKDVELRLCVECCLHKGYAGYKQDKGKQVLTFFV